MAAKKKSAVKAPKAATVAPVAPANPLVALIDELGRLEAELAPFAGKIARIKALRDAVRGAADPTQPAEAPLLFNGTAYTALYGPREKETIIDRPKLVELIGAEAYAKFATTTQKALFANVENKLHLALVLRTELSGPRSLKIVPRSPKEPAAEAKAA